MRVPTLLQRIYSKEFDLSVVKQSAAESTSRGPPFRLRVVQNIKLIKRSVIHIGSSMLEVARWTFVFNYRIVRRIKNWYERLLKYQENRTG